MLNLKDSRSGEMHECESLMTAKILIEAKELKFYEIWDGDHLIEYGETPIRIKRLKFTDEETRKCK